MNPALKLSTKPELFKPVEVEIDGEIFRVKPFALGDLEQIQGLYKESNEGSAAAIRQIIEIRLEGNLELIKKLPLDEIRKLIELIVTQSIKLDTEEKNE